MVYIRPYPANINMSHFLGSEGKEELTRLVEIWLLLSVLLDQGQRQMYLVG